MLVLRNYKKGDRVNVRYQSLIQYAEVVFNNPAQSVITLSVVVGGCCGRAEYKNIAYSYDSFDLKC